MKCLVGVWEPTTSNVRSQQIDEHLFSFFSTIPTSSTVAQPMECLTICKQNSELKDKLSNKKIYNISRQIKFIRMKNLRRNVKNFSFMRQRILLQNDLWINIILTKQSITKNKSQKETIRRKLKLFNSSNCLSFILPSILTLLFCTLLSASLVAANSIASVVSALPSTGSASVVNSQYYTSLEEKDFQASLPNKPSFEEILIVETQKQKDKSLKSAANAAEAAQKAMQQISDSSELSSIIVPSSKSRIHNFHSYSTLRHKNIHQKHERKRTSYNSNEIINSENMPPREEPQQPGIQTNPTSAAFSSNLFKEYLTRGLYNCTANYISVITKLQELIRVKL